MQCIVTQDLSVGYKADTPLLQKINVSANKGELVALLGANGIGKSTLLRTLCGLQKTINGNVVVQDTLLTKFDRNKLAQTISFVNTEKQAPAYIRVTDFVALGRFPYSSLLSSLSEKDKKIVRQSLAFTDIEHLANKSLAKTSDGERQRALIARALAQDTPIIMMDEPTAFLDIHNKHHITSLLHKLCNNEGKTVIFSTHDFQTAMRFAHKLWVIDNKQLLEGAPEDLVLLGVFDHFMADSTTMFDVATGELKSTTAGGEIVFVPADTPRRYWIERALQRADFAVSNQLNKAQKQLYYHNNQYIININNHDYYCDTLYQVVSFLQNYDKPKF